MGRETQSILLGLLGGVLITITATGRYTSYVKPGFGPLLMISPCNTYPGLTRPFGPGEPDKHYPTGLRNYLRIALTDDLQG